MPTVPSRFKARGPLARCPVGSLEPSGTARHWLTVPPPPAVECQGHRPAKAQPATSLRIASSFSADAGKRSTMARSCCASAGPSGRRQRHR